MRKLIACSATLVFLVAVLFRDGHAASHPSPDDQILRDTGIQSWVPNPLIAAHHWKKFYSDEKHSISKKPESIWYYDSKTTIKATSEKLNFKGEPLALEGATLTWVKVVELRTNRARYLYYGLWREKRVVLFFGIFEREDGTKYIEEVSEKEDLQTLPAGMMREVLESLFSAVFKPWWKVW